MGNFSLARRFSLAVFGHTCTIQHWGEPGAYSLWSLKIDDVQVVESSDDFLDLLKQGIKYMEARKLREDAVRRAKDARKKSD